MNLAVRVIYTIKLWDIEERKVMKVMETRDRGVNLFVTNMEHQFAVIIKSKPVWGTIENAVNKVLDLHQAQRNKEKNRITGGGDKDDEELESDEERRKRMERERLYDKMLDIRQNFKDWRQVVFVCSCCHLRCHIYVSKFMFACRTRKTRTRKGKENRRTCHSWQEHDERGT